MKLEEFAAAVSKETGIPLCGRDVERVVAAVIKTPDFWQIVEYSEEPLPVVAAVLRLFIEEGLAEKGREGLFPTPACLEAAAEKGIHAPGCHVCPRCEGKTVVEEAFSGALDLFRAAHRRRPPALQVFDQAFVTPRTTFARVALADARGDVRGKDILVLGDDDLVGLALAFTGLPKSVTVLEIDERIVAFEDEESSKLAPGILTARRQDLRKPLPQELVSAFDAFFCDPPETVAAFDAFIGRGTLSLKGPGRAGYFGLTSSESSFSKWKVLQEGLLSKGFVVTDLIRRFNEYVNWDYTEDMKAWEMAPVKKPPRSNWYRSAMFRVELVERHDIPNEDLTDCEIYNDRESSTV